MNRGYKVYYKEGRIRAKETLKKKGNILKYYLRGLISFIGKITLIVSPVCALSDVRNAKYAKEHCDIVLIKSFETGDNSKNYWASFLSGLYKFVLFLSGIIAIVVAAALLVLVGLGVAGLFSYNLLGTITIIFLIPGIALLVAFLIQFPLFTRPIYYVIDSLGGTATDAVGKSFNAMSKTGKRTLFVNDLLTTLKVLAVFVFWGIVILIANSIFGSIGIPMLVNLLFPVAFIIGGKTMSYALLSRSITEILFFEDAILDKYNANKKVKGIDLVRTKAIKQDIQNIEENLVRLFDETKDVKSSNEFDNDIYDEVFNQEAKEVVSTIHKINEEEPVEEVVNTEVVNEEVEIEKEEEKESVETQPVEEVKEEIQKEVNETPVEEKVAAEEKEAEEPAKKTRAPRKTKKEEPKEEVKEVLAEETKEEVQEGEGE